MKQSSLLSCKILQPLPSLHHPTHHPQVQSPAQKAPPQRQPRQQQARPARLSWSAASTLVAQLPLPPLRLPPPTQQLTQHTSQLAASYTRPRHDPAPVPTSGRAASSVVAWVVLPQGAVSNSWEWVWGVRRYRWRSDGGGPAQRAGEAAAGGRWAGSSLAASTASPSSHGELQGLPAYRKYVLTELPREVGLARQGL